MYTCKLQYEITDLVKKGKAKAQKKAAADAKMEALKQKRRRNRHVVELGKAVETLKTGPKHATTKISPERKPSKTPSGTRAFSYNRFAPLLFHC